MVKQQQSQRWGETEGETDSRSPARRLNLSNIQNVSCSSTLLYCSDSLRAGWPGDRTPVGCGIPHPFTGPGAHPASNTKGTGSFLRVKRPGRGVNHPTTASSAEVEERADVYLYSPSAPLWPVLGHTLPLPFTDSH
jgi:hypothetical protein